MEDYKNGTDRVFVCGGGHQGLSMAAHLALNGVHVTLWNRTSANIQEVINTHKILNFQRNFSLEIEN